MYRGVLIEESLENLGVLGLLRQLSTDVVKLAAPADAQPGQWTLITFEVDDTDAANVANQLGDALVDGPWYVDFKNGGHSYVVFADHVFDCRSGDSATLDAAKNHARGRGIPDGTRSNGPRDIERLL